MKYERFTFIVIQTIAYYLTYILTSTNSELVCTLALL